MDNESVKFIDRLYKDLYFELRDRTNSNKDRLSLVGKYLEQLERIDKGFTTSDARKKALKEFYFRKYVISEEDIPAEYYVRQIRNALDMGYGNIEIDDSTKKELAMDLIKKQKNSLNSWLDYLLDNDVYPFWVKYWAFQGMLQIGRFNIEDCNYSKRSKKTVKQFIDVNPEALSLAMDLITKHLKKETIDDKELDQLVKNGSFPKLYIRLLNRLQKDAFIEYGSDGKWVKFDKGSDYRELVKSLEGKNTGWCIAGDYMAEKYLFEGDFYIFYTKDKDGNYTQPRIAIRMEGNSIAEIRGIAKDQNLESNMEGVLSEKLKEFSPQEVKKYNKKTSDMKKLTAIYKKYENGEELNATELMFLYEFELPIEGFGFGKDPRISEIKSKRDREKDYRIIINNLSKDVVYENLSLGFLTSGSGIDLSDLSVNGNLDLSGLEDATGLKLPKRVGGRLDLSELENCENLVLPEYVGGDLILGARDITKLKLPKEIKGSLLLYSNKLEKCGSLVIDDDFRYCVQSKDKKIALFYSVEDGNIVFQNLKYAKELIFPKEVGRSLDLRKLEKCDNLVLPECIDGDLILGIRDATGLKLPKKIGGDLILHNLENGDNLVLPESVGGGLYLSDLKDAKGLKLPKKVEKSLYLELLEKCENLVLSEYVGFDLNLRRLKEATGLKLPKEVGGCLDLTNLEKCDGLILPESVRDLVLGVKDVTGLKLPKVVKNDLVFLNLEKCENLIFPEYVGFNLNLMRLKEATGLKLPKKVERNLDLRHLEKCENSIFPEYVGFNLNLMRLKEATGLKLPKEVGGCLDLRKLEKCDDLILPESVRDLVLSVKDVTGLKLPKVIKNGLYLLNLEKCEGLVLPESVGELQLDIKDATGLKLPKVIKKGLSLSKLEKCEGLVLPEYMDGLLILGIKDATGLKLPKKIGGDLILRNLENGDNLVLPEYIGGNLLLDNLKEVNIDFSKTTIKGSIKIGNKYYSIDDFNDNNSNKRKIS